jgi:hypothetical protein
MIRDFFQDRFASFASTRYIRDVNEFPRTETFRIKKNELKNLGITRTPSTQNVRPGMPDPHISSKRGVHT